MNIKFPRKESQMTRKTVKVCFTPLIIKVIEIKLSVKY